MKKIKQIVSFMLVGVLVLTGSFMLTGCFKDEKPVDKDVQKAITVLTNLNNIYLNLEAKSETCIDQEIPEISAKGDDVESVDDIFSNYELSEKIEEFSTLDEYYVDFHYYEGIMPIAIQLLKINNFEFDKFYSFEFVDDEFETKNVIMSLEFSYNKIRFVIITEADETYLQVDDVFYEGNKPIAHTTLYLTEGESDSMSFTQRKMSTYEGIGFDYILNIGTETDWLNLNVWSELTREKAEISGDNETASDYIAIVQRKRAQLKASADYNMDNITTIELSSSDVEKIMGAIG